MRLPASLSSEPKKSPKLAVVGDVPRCLCGIGLHEQYAGCTGAHSNNYPLVPRNRYILQKLLIPLSFICILGGTTTLIGTSTNLIVDAVARDSGLDGFGIFEITPYGLIAAVAGTIMMVLFSSWLLPSGQVSGEFASSDESDFLTELTVRNRSTAIGKKISEIPIVRRPSVNVSAVKRLSSYIRHDLETSRTACGRPNSRPP